MYKCDVCGRETFKKIRMGGYTLCSKHMHQLHKYGKFLDNNPRTQNDLNEYHIKGKDVYFDLYNIKCEKVAQFVVDFEDIEKVKYHKWRISHGQVVTGQPAKGQNIWLSHIIAGVPNDTPDVVVDHRDGDTFNNRKSNLRICPQQKNVCNKSFMSTNTSGFIGVSYDKNRNRYSPEIRTEYQRYHLGRYKTMEEAVYARLIAERILFGEYANQAEQEKKISFTASLPAARKDEIEKYVSEKLSA